MWLFRVFYTNIWSYSNSLKAQNHHIYCVLKQDSMKHYFTSLWNNITVHFIELLFYLFYWNNNSNLSSIFIQWANLHLLIGQTDTPGFNCFVYVIQNTEFTDYRFCTEDKTKTWSWTCQWELSKTKNTRVWLKLNQQLKLMQRSKGHGAAQTWCFISPSPSAEKKPAERF